MKYQKEAKSIFDKIFKKVSYWISEQSFMLGFKAGVEITEKRLNKE